MKWYSVLLWREATDTRVWAAILTGATDIIEMGNKLAEAMYPGFVCCDYHQINTDVLAD